MDKSDHDSPYIFFDNADNADNTSQVLENHGPRTTATSTENTGPVGTIDGIANNMQASSSMSMTLPGQQKSLPIHDPVTTMDTSGYVGTGLLYSMGAQANVGQSNFRANPTWQSASPSPVFGHNEPSANPALLNRVDYQQYAEDPRVQQQQLEDQSLLFNNNFAVPAAATNVGFGYPYGWDSTKTSGMNSSISSDVDASVSLGATGASSSSIGVATPASLTSLSSSGAYTVQPNRPAPAYQEPRRGSKGGLRDPAPEDGPQNKRTKRTRPPLPGPGAHRASFDSDAMSPMSPPTPAASSPGSSRGGAKLRTSTRTAKSRATTPLPPPPLPPATTIDGDGDDKTPKTSHNVVEKQYRNRLNAQFEGLMNALPDNLRAQNTNPIYGEIALTEQSDRRLSKAEVLELARQHIQSLEQERDTLERERNELRMNVKKLKETYAKGEEAQGRSVERWPGEEVVGDDELDGDLDNVTG